MQIDYVRLLQIQRDLYRLPRDRARFEKYLDILRTPDRTDVRYPPLVLVNPMARDHASTLLDDWLALDAEGAAERAAVAAAAELTDVRERLAMGLALVDDLGGGWTHRHATDFSIRFESAATLKRGWVSTVLWTSERPSLARVREEAGTAVFRAAYQLRHGSATSLREMMAQEGWALAQAKASGPHLGEDEIEYTREVIEPHLETRDHGTILACLFGDQAARSLGHPSEGLSENAGLALALHDAKTVREEY